MPDNIYLPLQVPNLPEGFCNQLTGENWAQVLLNAFGQSVAVLNTGSGAGTITLNQESPPSPEQRGFLWRKPSTGRIYQWDPGGGAWTSPHQYPPADPVAAFWVEATPAEIWAWDGGDGSDPSVVTPNTNVGAMWVIDTRYEGRSPMGAGSIPDAFPAKVLSIGENYGEGSHLQTIAELPAHTHPPKGGYGSFAGFVSPGQPSTFEATSGTEIEKMTETGPTGEGTRFNVTSPVRGNYRIIRSARRNYVG